MARGVRTKFTDENLSDSNLEKVIALLEASKPITKKTACEMLRIAYNTSRLDKLINDYKDKIRKDKEAYEKKKGTAYTDGEKSYIVSSYLEGMSIEELSRRIHRSTASIRTFLKDIECPTFPLSQDYFNPELIPDVAVQEKFADNEKVWSARYASLATVRRELPGQPGVYCLWLEGENWQQFAYQPWWELGSLKHLKQHGVSL